jgi:hypothetical protein
MIFMAGSPPGQGGGIVIVFVTLSNGEQALPYQSQEIMFNLEDLAGIAETMSGLFRESVALVYLSQQQTASIGGDPAPGKIGNDLLVKKTFKGELVVADCFYWASLLRGCLSGDYSMLADALSSFKTFSWIIRARSF